MEERKTLLQRIQWELQHMKDTEHLFDAMQAEVESVDEETNTIVYRIEPLPWMQISFGVITAAAQLALMEVLLTLSSWAITGTNQWRGVAMQADCLRRFDDTGRFWLSCTPDHLGRRMVQMSGFFYTDPETKKPVTQCRMKQMRLDG